MLKISFSLISWLRFYQYLKMKHKSSLVLGRYINKYTRVFYKIQYQYSL